MKPWTSVTLADVCTRPQYGAIAKGSATPKGPLFVRQSDITNGRIDWSSVPFCDLAPDEFEKYAINPGDILISRLGNGVGNAATVSDTNGAVFAGYLVRFRTNPEVAIPEFVGYQLQSKNWRQHVANFRSGAAQPTLNAQQMGEYSFLLPPIDEQRAIASMLGSLDDKIESDRRTIEKLLALGRALYEQAIASGSRQAAIGEFSEFLNRRRIPLSSKEREARPGAIPYYGATGIFGYVDDFLFDEVLVLVGEDGSVVRDDGGPVTQYIWGKTWINNHAHPLRGRGISNELLYLALDRSDIRPLVTGAVQPKVSMGNLKSLVIDLPTQIEQARLESLLSSLFDVLRCRSDEVRYLEQLRDTLLPELLSGRIRRPRAYEEVSGYVI